MYQSLKIYKNHLHFKEIKLEIMNRKTDKFNTLGNIKFGLISTRLDSAVHVNLSHWMIIPYKLYKFKITKDSDTI